MAGFDKNKIHECLVAVSDDSINHSQLTELVRISRLIIQSYLINYRSKVLNLITRNGITITDLSYDCIADAFARNGENKFYIIKKFISSLNDNINEIEALNLFLAYKSFLIKVADAQLSKLYSQSDPIGSKILRNVKDVVRRSDKFAIVKNLRGLTLVVSNSDELFCKPEFPLGKIITAYVQEVPAPGHQQNVQGAILYNFGKDMKLNSVVPGDDFTSNYNRLLKAGKVKEPLDSNYTKKRIRGFLGGKRIVKFT